ncbi:P-II family nitrogen regulator [Streptococcus rifensis]
MNTVEHTNQLELLYAIVNSGQGNHILKLAQEAGIQHGTIVSALGTVKHPFMDFLSLYDAEKDIVLMVSWQEKTQEIMDYLEQKVHFEKPNHGLLFSISACQVIGAEGFPTTFMDTDQAKGEKKMYHLITTIVEQGFADNVIEAAEVAGSRGGTIINGRGSGSSEMTNLFNMTIEPEKELVWIVAPKEDSDKIIQSIRHYLRIDEPGRGIIYVQTIDDIYGLYKGE